MTRAASDSPDHTAASRNRIWSSRSARQMTTPTTTMTPPLPLPLWLRNSDEEPLPKAAQRARRLTSLERLFRGALGILRYESGAADPEWLTIEAVLVQLLRRGVPRGEEPLSVERLKAALDLDPTRVEMFGWRECLWVRAKPRWPKVQRVWRPVTAERDDTAPALPWWHTAGPPPGLEGMAPM